MTKIADKAKKKAWNDFKERYSNADQGKISALVSFGEAPSRPGQKPKRQATAEVYLNRSDGGQASVSGSGRRYWNDDMKRALRIGGFVLELTLNRRRKKEVPAVPFHRNAFSRLNKKIKIFVTANQYFNAKSIGIFAKTKIQHSPTSQVLCNDRLWNIS